LPRIDNVDLNLFEFDYDLTFMVFFLNAEGKVYARYGGRDEKDAENRQSLAGLHYTMKSVLEMHAREKKEFAPRSQESTRFIRDVQGARGRGCMHCHQVREALNNDLRRTGKWSQDLFWRYPQPENVGMRLEVDRGNVVEKVQEKTSAAAAGLKAGDVLQRLGNVPVHSFGDAQLALDRAPKAGALEVVWQRDGKVMQEKLELTEGWRRTDTSWRTSMRRFRPALRLYGAVLTAQEKEKLGLPVKQVAFRQRDPLTEQAKAAGVAAGDIILGVDDKTFDTDLDAILHYVQSHYLLGDKLTVNLLRDGKQMNLPMTLIR
jgi:predicted metalloprotease with PDZ domain